MAENSVDASTVAIENDDSLGEKLWCVLKEYEVEGSELDVDITRIICEDGVTKFAHRFALKVSSKYFEEILSGNSQNPLRLQVSSDIMDLILEFIYGKQKFNIGAQSVIPLYSASRRLKITALTEKIVSNLRLAHFERIIDEPDIIENLDARDMQIVGHLFSGIRLTPIYKNELVKHLLRWKGQGENRSELTLEVMESSFLTKVHGKDPNDEASETDSTARQGIDLSKHCFILVPPKGNKIFHEITKLIADDEIRQECFRRFKHPSPKSKTIGCVLKGDLLFELSPGNLSVFKLSSVTKPGSDSHLIQEVNRMSNEGFEGITLSDEDVYVWNKDEIFRVEFVNKLFSLRQFIRIRQFNSGIDRVFGLFPEKENQPSLAVITDSDPKNILFYGSNGRELSSLLIKDDSKVSKILTVSSSSVVGIENKMLRNLVYRLDGITSRRDFNIDIVASSAVVKHGIVWASSDGYIDYCKDWNENNNTYIGSGVDFIDVI